LQKLELTWIGKGKETAVEPHILLHDAGRDYGDPDAQNMLIHGDNLLFTSLSFKKSRRISP
jgi:adenine-specific DNA-methyltransferase